MQYMARNIVSCINWYVYASSCSSLFSRNIIKTPAATTISLETRITAPENNNKETKWLLREILQRKRSEEISPTSARLNEARPQPHTRFKYQNLTKSSG